MPPSKNTRARVEEIDKSDLENESEYEYQMPAQTFQLEQQPSSYDQSKENITSVTLSYLLNRM